MSAFIKPPIWSQLKKGHPLVRGIIAYWPMSEGTGHRIINDLSGNRWKGTLSANVSWAPGKFGISARSPGGADDKIAIAEKNLGKVHTMSVWISRSTGTEEFTTIGGTAHNDGGYLLWADNQGGDNYRLYYSADGSYDYVNTTLVAGVWYHIVVVRNHTSVKFYQDGVSLGSISITDNDTTVNSIMNLGTGSTAYSLNGKMSTLILWNRPLVFTEIAQLYQKPFAMVGIRMNLAKFGLPPTPPTAKPWWYYNQMMAMMRRTV